ncbi:hypothetical protein OsJ_22873 [Oryza sativa Japonica Group]|uniref:Uncharacterized protein n=1 Tax=Oryza sativa subsp. japonica TaxID=39947 RepID=A3BFZ6_ORYSJ|nr:hypothetical protein OsJ_22873 [Oryza sativa Japonica Group]
MAAANRGRGCNRGSASWGAADDRSTTKGDDDRSGTERRAHAVATASASTTKGDDDRSNAKGGVHAVATSSTSTTEGDDDRHNAERDVFATTSVCPHARRAPPATAAGTGSITTQVTQI